MIVGDLIRASAPDLNAFRFPSGDKGGVRGFDGHLVAATAGLNVPAGRSFWEFGTNQDYKSKAASDFIKRTGETPDAVRSETTYVFVSPWTWDSSKASNKIEDWVAARLKGSGWRDILFIDGVQLAAWLEQNPGVAAWHARNTLSLAPAEGVRSTDDFWADYSGRFGPRLTEEVLLCERDEQARYVLEQLMGPPTTLSLIGDSQDEVVAFVIAVIRKADPAVRLFLEARSLVVDSTSAGRQLLGHRGLVLMVREDAARSPSQFAIAGSVVVPLTRQQRGGAGVLLPRPSGWAMGRAMQSMGLPEQEALTLARGSGRSLAALARLKPGGTFEPPEWVKGSHGILAPLLAGAWDAANKLDRAVIEKLAGDVPYDKVEIRIRELLGFAEPPFDMEGSVWAVRAPMDAFMHVGRQIATSQAERLHHAMVEVFGTLDAESADELFVHPIPDPTQYSSWLRQGLATTLDLFAVWSGPAGVNLQGETGQAFADRTIRAVPGLGIDYRLLTSLQQELPLLAEAAPGPLLSALEQMLGGDGAALRPIFEEQPGLLFPRAQHTGLLWALETLAWDPAYFRRAVLILARLADMDPGGQIGNRPLNSLAEIFVLWNPNTNASAALRLGVLDEVIRTIPAVGWKLLAALLPARHSTSSPTAKPKLREAGAAERPPITYKELGEMNAAVVERALDQAGRNTERWDRLIRGYALFAGEQRVRLVADLEVVLASLEGEPQKQLWIRLRDEVARHERFSKAKWALSQQELVPLQSLVARFAPGDRLIGAAFLFESMALDGEGDLQAANRRRALAIQELLAEGGVQLVFELASQSKNPYLVVEAVEGSEVEEAALKALLDLAASWDIGAALTLMLGNLYVRRAGETSAREWLSVLQTRSEVSPAALGTIISAFPYRRSTWSLAKAFGRETEQSYWRTVGPWHLEGPRRDLIAASLKLLRAGRASVVIQALFDRMADAPSKLLLRALDGIVEELNDGRIKADTMLDFYIERALGALDERSDLDGMEIAKREYAFLPLLEHGSRKLRVYRMMAESPELYVSILQDVFLAEGVEKGEIDKETANRAHLGYKLLSHFDLLPGAEGQHVDGAALTSWIDRVRTLGRESGRGDVAENYVGRTLAHAPADADGGWPHREVRSQIERLASDRIENAIQIERFNMRGVHGREIYGGGAQERELAAQNRRWATIASAWPRTAGVLTAIAENWDQDAQRMDVDAAQRMLRS